MYPKEFVIWFGRQCQTSNISCAGDDEYVYNGRLMIFSEIFVRWKVYVKSNLK